MGQYYKPVNIDSMECLCSYDFAVGSKLIEHGWIGNTFVGAVMSIMKPGQRWYKAPIVWAEDYYGGTENPEDNDISFYDTSVCTKSINTPMSMDEQLKAILVNHTKKEYVVFSKVPINEETNWQFNPLVLLTTLGNGRGGGDFDGTDLDKVGIWAKDRLSIETDIPDNFKELKVYFDERIF